MGFTKRASGALGLWLAFTVCGVHQAIARDDPPSSAEPVKADTAAAAPAATPASTTNAPEKASQVATPASTTAGATGATRVPAVVVKSTLEDSVLTNDEVKRLQQEGYKQEKLSNGDILYCRREDHLGSMVPKKQCVTGAQLKARAEDKRQFEELLQEKSGMPRPTTTPPGSRPGP